MNQVYRRLIVELGQGGADDALIRLAAEFALGMGLDLHGLFIEDEALLHVAAMPFAREIRLPSHQWQTMTTGRMEAELHLAAETAHRRLRHVVAELGIHAAFEVRRGQPHLCIAGVCTAADIVVMPAVASTDPGGPDLLRSAEESVASVLLVPRHPGRLTGAVAVVAGPAGDPAVHLAARIAVMRHDRLFVVQIPDGGATAAQHQQQAGELGIPSDRVTLRNAGGSDADDVLRALGDARERLVVLTRAAMVHLGIDDASHIARARNVPVLVL
jgi:hypothetical protein